MKRTSIMIKALLLGVSLLSFASLDAQAGTVWVVSDSTWAVTNPTGTFLGFAQNVCLSAGVPSNCPAGAMLYGYPHRGWETNISSIPGATWIWAPDINGATSPAFPS